MTFDLLPKGDKVFLDANTLIYHFTNHARYVLTAASLSQQFELLTGDALVVAAMRHHGLSNLASEDSDFDRVPGITRFAPV
jgi:predicted nucleic acid-binding protein